MAKGAWSRLLELIGSGAEGVAVSSRTAAAAREFATAERLIAKAGRGEAVDAAALREAQDLIAARNAAAARAATPAATTGTPAAPRSGTPAAATPAAVTPTAATPAAPRSGTPAATPAAVTPTAATPASPHTGTPAAPAGTPAAPHTGTPPAGTQGSGSLAPATQTQPNLLRRLYNRIGWKKPVAGLAVVGSVGYGALQVDDAVRNPVQTPDQKRLQEALDRQQREATTANVDRGRTIAVEKAKRDGITTDQVIGAIPQGRDNFERALPNAGGTGNLAAVSPVGATVRSLQETLPDGTKRRVLEFDYSNLAFGNGDKVEFPASRNGGDLHPREMARGVYRVDDPGPRATQVVASVTYSGLNKEDVLPLTGNALANRHTASVATPAAPTPAAPTPAARAPHP